MHSVLDIYTQYNVDQAEHLYSPVVNFNLIPALEAHHEPLFRNSPCCNHVMSLRADHRKLQSSNTEARCWVDLFRCAFPEVAGIQHGV